MNMYAYSVRKSICIWLRIGVGTCSGIHVCVQRCQYSHICTYIHMYEDTFTPKQFSS